MIECGYFLGLTNKGFIKEVKMDEYTHEESSLPKIGELFTGRYTDDSACRFVGLVNAHKDGEPIFISKDNKIEKVNNEKLNKKIVLSFQNLINELAAIKLKDVSDYSFLNNRDDNFYNNGEESSYNLEVIKRIENVYNIEAIPEKELNIENIKKELNNITCYSSLLNILDDKERLQSTFNRYTVGMVATGLTYGKLFEVDDVINSAYPVSFGRNEDEDIEKNKYYVGYSELANSWRGFDLVYKQINNTKQQNRFKNK